MEIMSIFGTELVFCGYRH